MNGLQAIQDRILTEARERADQITGQAQASCAAILAAARTEAEQLLAQARQSAANQASETLTRARSAAAMQQRKADLQSRQELIDQVLARAIERLGQLPPERKIDLYRQLLRQTQAEAGEIELAAADLPLAGRLLEGLGGSLTIAGTAGSFTGGLILRRGLIEDNLTFERLAAIKRPDLVQLAAAALADAPSEQVPPEQTPQAL